MTLGIVLVSWRNERQTLRCAQLLDRWGQPRPYIVLIDNESTAGTRAALGGTVEVGELVHNPVNSGYGGGNNLGIKRVLAAGCEYVLLLNSDADLTEESAGRLVQRLKEKPEISILGPALREAIDHSDQLSIGGRDMALHPCTRIKVRPGEISKIPAYPLHSVDYVPGAVFLVRADVFRDVGLLDEEFFFSGEIADFCKRSKDRGHKVCVDLEVEARHRAGSTASCRRDALYTYYNLRNRFLYARKHHAAGRHFYFAYWTMIAALMLIRALAQRSTKKKQPAWRDSHSANATARGSALSGSSRAAADGG
jgi:GT2 family glycosyltransferase